MLGEWDMELSPGVAAGTSQRGPRDQTLRGGELGADMFLVNGHAHGGIAPVVVKEGERVLLRMINAGHMAHPIHLHGHSFKIVATDGNPIPQGMEWTKDTILIGPAERYDLEFIANNPGVWMFHCHIEHHMANGMMTVLQYEGEVPTGPAADLYSEVVTTGHDGHDTTEHSDTPATPDPVATEAAVAPATDGSNATIAMLDDRFDPTTLNVPAGTTVTWVNRGANWHSIAAYDGSFTSEKLAPGASFDHRFDAPGTYEFLCQHHALQGMLGKVEVT
jgi:plastocyanin